MNRDIIAVTKYKFNVYGKKGIRSGRDSAVVGIVGKSKSLDFPTMLIFGLWFGFEYGVYYSPVSTPADFRLLAPVVLEQV